MNLQIRKILLFGNEILCRNSRGFCHQNSGRSLLQNFTCTTSLCNNNVVNRNVANPARLYGTASTKDMNASTSEQDKLAKFKAKKTAPATILLINEQGKIQIVTLEDAAVLAKKGGLHLVEVDGTTENLKTDKPVYKLVSHSDYFGEDVSKPKKNPGDSKTKEEKTVMLKSKTSEHDILVKVKSIKKWVEKGHNVRILIGQGGQDVNPESVYKIMEANLKDEPLRIVQKVVKGSQIRFQVMPPKLQSVKQFAGQMKSKEHTEKQRLAKKQRENEDDEDEDDDDEAEEKDKK